MRPVAEPGTAASRLGLRIFSIFVAGACICMPAPHASLVAGESEAIAFESDVKAAYIVNFIRFTDWLDDLPGKTDSRLRLSVFNDQNVYEALKAMSKTQHGRQLGMEVQTCSTVDCIRHNSVLYIGQSGSDQHQQLLEAVRGWSILTVSDIPDFARQGGMIEIRQSDNRLTFIINLDVVRKANLYVSAQLLQLASIIREDQLQLAVIGWGR